MTRDQIENYLTRLVDAGLIGVVFLVPSAMGGRHAPGHAILVLLAIWLAVCWCLRQIVARQRGWTPSIEPILLAAVLLTAFQLVPLPPGLLARLSPRVYELLPLWSPPAAQDSVRMGTWQTLSLDPEATRSCLVLLLSFTLIFVVTVQRIRRLKDIEWLLRLIAIATVVMAAFGLVQYLAGNGKFFWFYEDPFSDASEVVKGSFTNRNHFAQFIALGLGPLAWWLFHGRTGREPGAAHQQPAGISRSTAGPLTFTLRLVALAVCILAVLLSLSRGGFTASCVAATVSGCFLYRSRVITGKTLLGGAAVVATLFALAIAYSYERVAHRLDDFQSLESLDGTSDQGGRRGLWKADLGAAADYPLFGTGMGTHGEVSPVYLQKPHIEYTHAENGYVQVALEAGFPGLLLACSAAAVYGYWCVAVMGRSRNGAALLAMAGIAPAIAASAVHSLFDFVWYAPGCMVPVVILGACACRLRQMEAAGTRSVPATVEIPGLVWAVAAGCLLLPASGIVPRVLSAVPAEQAWHRYLIQSLAHANDEPSRREAACRQMLETLSSVVQWQPEKSRAHARMAALHLELFEQLQSKADPPFGIAQLRDAALASRFPSSAALEQWLANVTGPNLVHLHEALRHARRGLALCPLQGTAYLVLAKLSFLEGPRSPGKAAYIAQAVRVRPLDGDIRFEAGVECLLAGRAEDAIAHWRKSFQTGVKYQKQLLEAFGSQLPVLVFLDAFQPDLDGIRRISAHYARLGNQEALATIRLRYAQLVSAAAAEHKGKEAAALWREAAGVFRALQADQDYLHSLRRALANDPSCYDARLQLAKTLMEMDELAEAERELMHCRRQRPYDKGVQTLLNRVVDKRIRMSDRGAVSLN